ncbi:class I tRNA ligase family protein [Kibdelosporangium persicum]|uniref:Methionyl-tRNA synthetase n=1 Tax=Kibdelosporangium persicum TaxID=2698649 RepID=A0ABX2EZ97_9PSEU|nr:class I tRNA ligase family protein [Kibdelosporangium persicum]NRN64214.1 Methionyl-tRNA synthetase [Kibdelosporangium persicum]
MSRVYVTTTSDASAAELVYADVLARHHRMAGARVWFLGGGDPSFRALLDLSYNAFDASPNELSRYLTSLGPSHYRRWWADSDERVHVIGKSAVPRHAVTWPQILLRADAPLPTTIFVHAGVPLPAVSSLAHRYGSDAVRWWLLRDPDLTADRLVFLANRDLHRRLGSLVDRVTVLVHRYRNGEPPSGGTWPSVSSEVRSALAAYDFTAAIDAVWRIVDDATAYLDTHRPWELPDSLDAVLAPLLAACRLLANELVPFLPGLATRIAEQCFGLSGSLAPLRALYPRVRK